MAIVGLERAIYGVDDLATCTRFFEDFGLVKLASDARESVFEVATGARVVLRARDDCYVKDWFPGNGVKLPVWASIRRTVWTRWSQICAAIAT